MNISIQFIHKKWIWLVVALFFSIVTAKMITDAKWIYLVVLFSPLLIYISFKKPFIFPFGLYVFLVPFENLLVVTGNSKGPTLTKYLAIMAIIVLLLKGAVENKLKRPDSVVIWWVLFIAYSFLSITWGIQPNFGRISTAIGLLVLYLVVASYPLHEKEYNVLKVFILASGFIIALLTIYQFMTVPEFGVRTRVSVQFGGRELGLNGQAFDLLLPISVVLAMMLEQKKKIYKYLLFLIFIVIFFSIILTGSRGSFLAAGIILTIYITFIKRRITFGILILVAAIIIIPMIPEFFMDRLEDSTESHASGRTDIWDVGLKSLGKYFIMGAGLDNFPQAYTEFVDFGVGSRVIGLYRAPHNIFLGSLVEFGIFGFSLMLIGIIKHYRIIQLSTSIPYNIRDYNQLMLKAAFGGMLVASMFLDTFWSKSFWLLWMMILMQKHVMKVEWGKNNLYSLKFEELLTKEFISKNT